MKIILTALLASALLVLSAEQVNKNGDFEKVKTVGSGTMIPEGWIINKGLSKKFTVTMSREKEDVHGGAFAMEIETEKDGTLFLMNWVPFEVKEGDILEFSIFAKGTGTIQLAYLTHGMKNGEKGSTFITTIASPSQKPSEDSYKKFTWKHKVGKLKKGNKTFDKVNAFPVLIIRSGTDVLLDDFLVKRSKPAPAAK